MYILVQTTWPRPNFFFQALEVFLWAGGGCWGSFISTMKLSFERTPIYIACIRKCYCSSIQMGFFVPWRRSNLHNIENFSFLLFFPNESHAHFMNVSFAQRANLTAQEESSIRLQYDGRQGLEVILKIRKVISNYFDQYIFIFYTPHPPNLF